MASRNAHAAGTGRWGWRLALGLAVTVAVGYAARRVDARAAWRVLGQADTALLGLALAAMLANIALKVVRWHWLYRPAPERPRLRRLLAALMVGQLGNVLLPARLGDAARLAVVSAGEGPGLPQSLLTLALEKAADSAMLLAVLLAFLPTVATAEWLDWQRAAFGAALVALAVAACLLVLLGPLRGRLLAFRGSARLRPLVARLQHGLVALGGLHDLRRPGYQARLWGLSLAIWLLAGLVNWFAFAALHLSLPLAAGYLLAVTEIAGNNVAYAPAGVGVYHAICILTLSLYGVALEPALGVAVLLHLVVYAPIVLGGLAAVWAESMGSLRPEFGAGHPVNYPKTSERSAK